MNISHKDIALIERYHRGELSDSEYDTFRLRLKSDESFRKKVEHIKALVLGVQFSNLTEMMDEMDKWEEEIEEREKKTQGPKISRIQLISAIAATLLILVVSLTYFSPSEEEILFKQEFEPYPQTVLTRGAGDSTKDSVNTAYLHYEIGHYDKAVEYFESLVAEGDSTHLLHLGVSYLAVKDTKNARPILDKLLNQSHPAKDQIEKYLCLCTLLDDSKEAYNQCVLSISE